LFVAKANKPHGLLLKLYKKFILRFEALAKVLALILLMWRIWRVPNNASRWQMGFNSAFKGLIEVQLFKDMTIRR
jgi:hypothetical protein